MRLGLQSWPFLFASVLLVCHNIFMIIYKCTNKINGKIYIGQTTKKLSYRCRMHRNSANAGSDIPFHIAIRKYGFENFSFEELAIAANQDELNSLEIKFISECDSLCPKGYIPIWQELTKEKASIKAKERMLKDNGKQFLEMQKKGRKTLEGKQPWNKGKKATDEAKANQSKAHLGQVAWNRRPIMCIETGQVFESEAKAAKEMNFKRF